MNNYVIEDETNNYYDKTRKISNNSNSKIIVIIIAVIIFLAILLLINKKNSNSFSSYENEMVSKAKQYVNDYGVNKSETYIDVSKLNVELPNTCSLLSGVIYDGNEYKPYLLCKDYESKIVDNSDTIKLNGSDVIILLKGMPYYELGYIGNNKVFISSSDNISSEGVYNIHYILQGSNTVVTRKVIVIDNPSLTQYYPRINSNSMNPITIEKGNNYDEAPVAIDPIDGNLTNYIIRVSNLDINTAGEYEIIYSVRNSLGYTTFLKQKVIVIDKDANVVNVNISLSNENITKDDIIAHVTIKGNNYKYAKLPDGSQTTNQEFDYTIVENGKYEFIVVSNDGTEIIKTLDITNINKTIPTGTCKALLYYNKTSISVNITSFNYIVGYNYYVNEKSSGYITTRSYTNASEKNVTNVYVIAKDYVGNEGKITCATEKVANYDPNGIRTVKYNNNQPRLRIPITEALTRKGHTVSELNACIYNRVEEAGPYTRYGVVAAAYGLMDCMYNLTGYVLSYDHTGGKVGTGSTKSGSPIDYCQFNSDICGKLGINTRWGKFGGSCENSSCWYGLNCANFVRWAMCNGGMNMCTGGSADTDMTSVKYFKEADGVYIKGKSVTYYSGTDLSKYSAEALLRMIKPGDAIATYSNKAHTFVVVGRDNEAIYTAEDGYYQRKIKFSEILNGQVQYRILFLDKFYDNPNNYNNLYK